MRKKKRGKAEKRKEKGNISVLSLTMCWQWYGHVTVLGL